MTEDLHLPRNMKKVQSLHGGTPRIWLKIVVSMIHNPGFVLSHCDKTQFNSEIDDLINCNSYQWFNIICKWFKSLQIWFRLYFYADTVIKMFRHSCDIPSPTRSYVRSILYYMSMLPLVLQSFTSTTLEIFGLKVFYDSNKHWISIQYHVYVFF